MEHVQIASTPRERFMRAVSEELNKFERHEASFRKTERKEREAELHVPAESDDRYKSVKQSM